MKKEMLFIVSDIHLNGGGERVTFNMTDYFTEQKYDVTVLSLSMKRTNDLFIHNDAVKIEYLGINNTKYTSKWFVYKSLRKFLFLHHYDIIFGIGTYPSVVLGFIKRFNNRIFKNCKAIGCEHSSFDGVNKIWRKLREISYPNLSATVVLTKDDLQKISLLNSNSYVIPNSITLPNRTSNLKSKKFVSIGRLSEGKRFDVMIKLFKKFSQINNDWQLIIVGDGDQLDNLNNLIRALEINNLVTIHPFSHNISEYYLNSSIFLMTSKTEGLPMVLLEAKSYGIPIISYDCDTGPRDIIKNGIDGFLIPMDDENKYLNAMVNLSQDASLLVSMSKESRKNAVMFSPENVFGKWENVLQNL